MGEKGIFSGIVETASWVWVNGPTSGPLVRRSWRRKVVTLAGIFPKKSAQKRAKRRKGRGRRGWRARILSFLCRPLSIFLAPRTSGDMQNACVHVNRYPLNCIAWNYAYCALNGPCAATRVVDFNYCNDSQPIINGEQRRGCHGFSRAACNLFRHVRMIPRDEIS